MAISTALTVARCFACSSPSCAPINERNRSASVPKCRSAKARRSSSVSACGTAKNSAFVSPIRSGMSGSAPRLAVSQLICFWNFPSATTLQNTPNSSILLRSSTAGSARASASVSMPRKRKNSTPFCSSSASVLIRGASYGWTNTPLSTIACETQAALTGLFSWAMTLAPPADCPAMVMLSGSPPKAAMLRLTHSRPACWSRHPKLAGASGCSAVSSG